jgi:rod shape-determining protein MreD
MIDGRGPYTALRAGLYTALALGLMGAQMLPVGRLYASWSAPDLLVCLTFAWVLRRPAQVPAALIAALVLLEDMLLLRPPGLWALCMLLGSEFLRHRQSLVREMTLPVEWALVAGVMLAMTLGNRLVLGIVMSPMPALGLSAAQLVVTILVYPLVVAALTWVLGLRKPATGELDELGRKL